MQLQYTQGLLRGQTDPSTSAKLFLQKSGLTVSIYVTDQPLQAVAIHRLPTVNYIIDETVNVSNAWACSPGACWLYWDIGMSTGTITRGVTSVTPAFGTSTPDAYYTARNVIPVNDQHYFNTTSLTHWRRAGDLWLECIRVFAASINSNGIMTPRPFASQVGIGHSFFPNGSKLAGGYILYTTTGAPIFNPENDTFLTTTNGLSTSNGNNNRLQVNLDSEPLYVLSAEPLPELRAVAPTSTGWVTANGPSGFMAIGITLHNVSTGTLFKPQTWGIIRHDQFVFNVTDFGKTVWLGARGELLIERPFGYIGQALGTVIARDAMYLNTAISMAGQSSLSEINSPLWTHGIGSPEGILSAGPGSMYTNRSGGTGITLYVKESGTGNTGWVAK